MLGDDTSEEKQFKRVGSKRRKSNVLHTGLISSYSGLETLTTILTQKIMTRDYVIIRWFGNPLELGNLCLNWWINAKI